MLELPMPPSANRYWRFVPRRGAVPSKEAKAFKTAVQRLYAPRPLTGRVAVRLDVYLCRGDLDNRIKATLDALKGIAFIDDRQVASLRVEEFEASSKTQRVHARITPFLRAVPMESEGWVPDPPAWKWPAALVAEQKRGRAVPNVVRAAS